MARTGTFPLYDRMLGGILAVLLQRWRDEGLSHAAIANRLGHDYDIHVTGKTVGRWLADLDGQGAA